MTLEKDGVSFLYMSEVLTKCEQSVKVFKQIYFLFKKEELKT